MTDNLSGESNVLCGYGKPSFPVKVASGVQRLVKWFYYHHVSFKETKSLWYEDNYYAQVGKLAKPMDLDSIV